MVDRMMGEFAAASVALAKGIDEEVRIEDLEAENRATSAAIREWIEEILLNSYHTTRAAWIDSEGIKISCGLVPVYSSSLVRMTFLQFSPLPQWVKFWTTGLREPTPVPVKTHTHECGCGFPRVRVRVALENPRVAHAIP